MRPLSPHCADSTATTPRRTGAAGRLPALALAIALMCAAVAVLAHPYPPYWGGGSGGAIHYPPVAWPLDANWIGYTLNGGAIEDLRTSDESNGGTSPQSYVNVSSGCTDLTEPSVYYSFNSTAQVL
jgi:hypothetical protein